MELERFKTEVLPLRGKLVGFVGQLLDDPVEAEDVVQETFLKLWNLRGKLDAYRQVEALAFTVAKNQALDVLKLRKTTVPLDALPLEGGSSPAELLEAHDAVGCIRRLVEALPPLQRDIIRMKDIEGYETEEIAEITGSRPEAVRVNLSRARKKIKEQFLRLNKEER
ncbi:MAG: RNA polymerase sigma factor [Tannerella sp.]|jgi:RNA polymerase sigma-70 factor (ECF subfamily)|nr:RNA polymerase sigma factor [Tannerella sp.]